ncbi:MAG: ParA family protein [Chloroflexota bacterium]|nr:ParA family protein [Chloroflexota bacterium]
MSVRIAVGNQKGGTAKTSTAISLASALARTGRRVVLIDLDPQGNATSALGVSRDAARSIHGMLLHDELAPQAVVPTAVDGLALIPSSGEMASAEIELVPTMAREFRLRASLASLQDHDVVLIDCPPSLGLLTINALVAADHVIVPVQCEYLALEGLAQLLSTIDAVKTRLNPQLSILAILLTMEDKRNRLSQQVADEVTRHFPELVARTRIPRSVRLAEAPSHGQPIDVYDPSSRAATAYADFAREIEDRLARRTGVNAAEVAS